MSTTAPATDYDQPLYPDHPRWREFFERLAGPEGCDFKPSGSWNCHGGTDTRFSRRVLVAMGLSEVAIKQTLRYFRLDGGYCDCEIVLNLGTAEGPG